MAYIDSTARTCVFYKGDILALKLNDEQKKAIVDAKILMIDGNEMDVAEESARILFKSIPLKLW